MKTLLLSFAFVLSSFLGTAQTGNNQANSPAFFAQCMVNVGTPAELTTLENQLRAIPYIQVARVDIPTHRLFLVTKDISSFSETEFVSWMGTYASAYSCLQIGLHGVDPIHPYPFTNCPEN